jgi:ABC-type glutathione transport system ATPase component
VLNGTDRSALLEVHELTTRFAINGRVIHAVEGVSFSVAAGEAVGLVGESGSGKSTVLRSLLGLVNPPGRVISGEVLFHGRDLRNIPADELRRVRGGPRAS